MHAETLETIKRSASVPSIPMVAARCYEMTRSPHCDYNKLVELLSTDPGIAASVLRMANSPLLGVTRQVASLKHAITLLGVKRIRELVLSRYLVQKTGELSCNGIDLNYFWRLSLTTAILASKLAAELLPHQRDEAFMGGLLADLGVIVLTHALPDEYAQMTEHYRPHDTTDRLRDEYVLMGVTHGEISAMVIDQWNLPRVLVEAVRYHHASSAEMPADCEGASLARIIGAAGDIARVLCQTSQVASATRACRQAMDRVELDVTVLLKALDGLEADIEHMADLLQVDVLDSEVFALICAQLIDTLQNTVETPAG